MNFISKIKNAVKNNNRLSIELKHHLKKSDDIYSMSILQSLLIGYPYVPFNGGALRPVGIAYILNEIIINQRQHIIEFGSGISTIMMARLIKKNNLSAKIMSIEHNEEWAKTLNVYLKEEGLLDYVQIIRTELRDIKTSLGTIKWYDYDTILKAIKGLKFDLIIIDGPPANSPKIRHSRLPALEKLKDNYASDYCIILDDVNRKGEQELVEFYKERNENIHFTVVSETLGVFRTVKNFNPIPIHY